MGFRLFVFGFAVLRQDYHSVAQASPKLSVTLLPQLPAY